MISYAPLPSVGEVLSALVSRPVGQAESFRAWCRTGEVAFGFSRSASALAAVAAERAIRLGRSPRVWLPGYFCNQALVPLRKAGVTIYFYPITEDLVPDLTAVSAEVEARPPDILLAVHYFGRPSDLGPVNRLAQQTGAILVEDAAHVHLPIAGVGEAGHVTMYSPHKWLPIPDGAVLVVRPPAGLSRDALSTQGSSAATAPWLLKRLFQKIVPPSWLARLRPSGPAGFEDDPPLPSAMPAPAMQVWSRNLIARADFASVVSQRRENLMHLVEVFSGCEGVRPWEALPDASPYRLVLRGTPERLSMLYRLMRRAGLPVETWPDLPPEVLAAPDRHRIALGWRRSALFVPIHQTVSAKQLVTAYSAALR